MPHRFYSRDFGRWLSPDPLGGDVMNPQSFNRYAYALNNPATLNDPLGLQASCSTQENCKSYGEWYGRSYALHQTFCGIYGCPKFNYQEFNLAFLSGVDENGGFWTRIDPGGFAVANSGLFGAHMPFSVVDTPANLGTPQTTGSCAQPNFVQRVGIAAQAWVARLTGLNIGVGVGGSGGIGHIFGVAGDVSRQMIVSPNGQAAIVTTFAATPPPLGLVEGAGVFGGLQFSIGSPTSSAAELASPAVVGSFGGGAGWGAGLDLAAGPSGWQGTLTLGGGAGLEGNGGAALIAPAPAVTPVCTQ